ncbi:MAG: hypothetical protein Q9166_005650 [cf. Caloplaca sp. 2 TL-2023]
MAQPRRTVSEQPFLPDSEDYLRLIESSRLPPDDMAADLLASLDPNWNYPAPDDEDNTSPGPYYGSSYDGNQSRSSSRQLNSIGPSESCGRLDGRSRSHALDTEDEGSEECSRAGTAKSTSGQVCQRHPDAAAISGLALKKKDKAKDGIELDDRGIRKGLTRRNGRQLEYSHHGNWIKAVFHYRIRGKLLRIADAKGQYEEEPERGLSRWDRTAFKADQKCWHLKQRPRRPECLFLWEDPGKLPTYEPSYWYDEGRIVLGLDRHPVKMWRELPLTISGQCEGLRMEAFRRLNGSITVRDIMARMPKLTSKGSKLVYKNIKVAMLANRCTRDRCRIGIKAWNPRDGSRVKERRMLEMIPFDIQKRIVDENSTRCFRDLTDAEVAYIDVGNKGTAASLKKAGPRMLTDEERQKRLGKKQNQVKNSKKNLDLESLLSHPVLEKAISKPGLNRIRRGDSRQSSAFTPPAAPEKPKDKRERGEDLEQDGFGRFPFETQGHAFGEYDEEMPRKKRRYSPAESVDRQSLDTEQHHEYSTSQYGNNGLTPSTTPSNVGRYISPGVSESHNENTYRDRRFLPNTGQHQGHPIMGFENYSHNSFADSKTLGDLGQHGGHSTPGFIGNHSSNRHNLPQAPSICHAGPDFRLKAPTTAQEQDLIQEALQISRDDCQDYLGAPPIFTTDRTESYAYQLSQLQNWMNEILEGILSPPVLRSHGFWTGAIDGFRALPTAQGTSRFSGKVPRGGGLSQTLSGMHDWEGETLLGGLEQR